MCTRVWHCVIVVAFLFIAASTLADHRGKPHGNGGGGSPPEEPQPITDHGSIKFCVTFLSILDDGTGTTVHGDGSVRPDGEEYCHGEDKMQVEKGKGPGFRLDTNGGSQKLEGAGGFRKVKFDGLSDDGSPVDARIRKDDGGVHLGELAWGETREVGFDYLLLDASVNPPSGNQVHLVYDIHPFLGDTTDPQTNPDGEAKITRIDDFTWEISGVNAFYVDGSENNPNQVPVVHMPFRMRLTDKRWIDYQASQQ